ncbi:ribose 5-phosphate isomerase A-domain-containing protein [Mucor lusitanicus]|uniref:Ribose-5-phosphate isomerase n=2 Tax=Mucor circinelloides f. lusitanicus TaxID=29924 RepID=A0A168MD39_MUCCL|nr:ribose-5-phosphate isomerase [Mucor lusitanicus]OAD04744.1 hypothetical protein MUCCIDRAFT_155701 [Mucor lusitanicus CBS 277.49]
MSACIRAFRRQLSTQSAEKGKQWAGYSAMKYLIQAKPSVIGLGSGSTIVYAIEYLKQHPFSNDVVCIPTSFQTRQLILQNSLKLGSLDNFPVVDMTIDGADEIDRGLNAIKGGGACLFQERLVAQASHRFILVADDRKKSDQLGTKWIKGVPVEVVPMALTTVQYQLERMFPTASIKLRMATPTDKAGPVVTDNGNLVLDCHFGPISDPESLYKEIKCVTGVLDVGLFCKMAERAFVGDNEGNKGEMITPN